MLLNKNKPNANQIKSDHQVQQQNHKDKFVSKKPIDLFIIGCGTIGGSLIAQIKKQQHLLLISHHISITVYGIANHKTFYLDNNGIELECWTESLYQSSEQYSLESLLRFVQVNQLSNPVIVDCTGSREVALRYQKYLENNFHVVTANKIANGESFNYYQRIREQASFSNKKFHYETNIGAGLPVIEPLQRLLQAGDQLVKFEGILSGSLSFIFGELHNGLTLSQATLKAKELGYTEPDPREDLSGMDVARKVLIIARETGLDIELSNIEVESILPQKYSELPSTQAFFDKLSDLDLDFSSRIATAEKNKQVLRYVARIIENQCKVSIEAVSKENPLYGVDDGENVLAFYSQYYQPKPLVIKGYGAGPAVTAAGVFSDLLRLVN